MEHTLTDPFLEALRESLPESVLIDGDVPGYRYSVTHFENEPIRGAVVPTGVEDVSTVMRLASEHRVPVTPVSGGTSYSGAVIPQPGGLILDLSRMNRVIEIDAENLVAVVEPGIVLKTLDRELAAQGVTIGHEPDSWFASTLGGACSTNGVGHRSTLELLSEQILGVEAVLPTGEVVTTRPVWKSSTGKDTVNHLFLGMEGAYGVLTRLHVRLRRLPAHEDLVVFGFEDFHSAARAAWEIVQDGVYPIGMYVLDGPRARALVGPLPGDPDGVLVAYLGGAEHMVAAQRGVIEAACGKGSLLESAAESWMLKRHYYVRASRRTGGTVTGTLTSFGRFTDFLTMFDIFRSKTSEHGFDDSYVGAMLYFGRSWLAASMLVGIDRFDEEILARHRNWETEIIDAQLALGGTADAVTSVGIWRADRMEAEHGNAHHLLRTIKQTLDPASVLNRGIRGLT